jgi:phage terminase large subunit GpA-like protein
VSGADRHPLADGVALVAGALREGLARPPRVDVAQWADAHRYLPAKGAAEPGRWRTDRVPFVREIMECLSPAHPAQRVVFCKSAQVAGTECGLNWVGAFIDTQRGPMLCVQPTLDMAERWSKQRLAPMIEASPTLRAKVAPARARDSGNTTLLKEFAGGLVVVAGANSAAGLRSMPARYLFLDEVDAYPPEIDGEGDPLALAEARTATFGRRRKVFLCSTPTTETRSRIWREYQASDQRRYLVHCPDCGHAQTLEWENLHWPDGEPQAAAYACAGCGVLIGEHHKTALLAGGRWVATHPERDIPGFWINGLYTPVGLGLSWGELAAEFERVRRDAFALRTFENVRLGRVTTDPVQRVDWEETRARAEDYRLRTVPAGALLLTAGVDVQVDRLAVHVVGHGRTGATWTVDYVELPGDPNRPEVWAALDELRETALYNTRNAPLRITLTAVDSGYLPDVVLSYTRPRQTRGVIAIKGAAAHGRPIIAGRPTRVDTTARGKTVRGGAEIWITGTDTAKALLYARLEADRGHVLAADRLVRFSKDLPDEFFAGLTAEYYDPARRRWIKQRPRNEPLDTWCYALAAAYHPTLRVQTWRPHQWDRLAAQLEPEADLFVTAPPRPHRRHRRRRPPCRRWHRLPTPWRACSPFGASAAAGALWGRKGGREGSARRAARTLWGHIWGNRENSTDATH